MGSREEIPTDVGTTCWNLGISCCLGEADGRGDLKWLHSIQDAGVKVVAKPLHRSSATPPLCEVKPLKTLACDEQNISFYVVSSNVLADLLKYRQKCSLKNARRTAVIVPWTAARRTGLLFEAAEDKLQKRRNAWLPQKRFPIISYVKY